MTKNTPENLTTFPGQKSGQKVAKIAGSKASTHGSFYKIKQRVIRDTERYFGRTSVPHYVIRLKQGANRGYFTLESDLDESAKKARLIKEHLRNGWSSTVAKFSPHIGEKSSNLTIGKFLGLVERHAQINPFTFHTYARKLRQIAAGVAGIEFDGAAKFTGTTVPSKWKLATDATLLEKITPTAVERWRSRYITSKTCADWNSTMVQHTANAIIRNARSLFAKRVLKKLFRCEPSMRLPVPLPFEGVDLIEESDADFYYVSEINASTIIQKALVELKGDVLVIFVLAIGAGLRRKEIDNLSWARVNLEAGTILVAPTATARLKSSQSLGELVLEPEFLAVLRQHAKNSKGEFVLKSDRPARAIDTYSYYRCDKELNELSEWLKGEGMKKSLHKLHTLRKEFGSGIAKEHGIHAACASLRQSSISLTAKHYAERKSVPTSYFQKNKSEDGELRDDRILEKLVRKLHEHGLEIKKSA